MAIFRTRGAVLLCSALALVLPHSAHAETDRDRAAARSAAESGADAFEQGRYAEALDFFSRAEQLFHAPPHLLFMARSAEKLGKLVDSHESYLKIVRETLPAKAPAAFRKAQTEATREIGAVEARLAYVTLNVRGASQGTPVLLMDGVELPSAIVGVALPVDPGVHVFAARDQGARSEDVTRRFGDGAKEIIVLTLPATSLASPVAPVVSKEVRPLNSDRDASLEVKPSASSISAATAWGVVALVAGASASGAGAYFTLSAQKSRNSADTLYKSCDPGCGTAEEGQIHHDDAAADRSMNLAIAGFVTGGVAITTGVVLLLTAHPRQQAGSSGISSLRVVAGTNWLGATGAF